MPKFLNAKPNYCKQLVILIVILAAFFYIDFPHAWRTIKDERFIRIVASDTYLRVADLDLTIPVVALREPSYAFSPQGFSLRRGPSDAELKQREEFKSLSSRPDTAPLVPRVEISIDQYQYTNERASSTRICPLLTRDWAQNFCKGEPQGMMNKLPQRFYIVDKTRIDTFSRHHTSGGERYSDQINSLTLRTAESSIACDTDSKHCTAVTQVSEQALAVWPVWSSTQKQLTAQQMADTQGAAIRAFVKYAISPQPDFEAMKAQFELIQ